MRAPPSDKIIIGAALALVVLSAGIFGALASRNKYAKAGDAPTVQLADANYTASAPDAPPVKIENWGAPVSQSRGDKWIYDTFTPPEIFYNAKSKQFTVRPPTGLGDENDTLEEFGVELVSVRSELFRLQLIGFAGEGANGKGIFQNVRTSEVFLATAGKRFADLGITVQKFDIVMQSIAIPESMASRQRVAIAVVHDEKANRDVTLTNRERVLTGDIFALVAPTGQSAAREVRKGDTFRLGDASYRVEKVQLTPPSVEITKESPQLTQPDRRPLTPREVETPDTPEAAPAAPAPTR